jgi:FixJ family two-component response regulator
VITPNQQLIYLVDDDPEVCGILERTLQSELDVRVVCFIAGHKCLENIKSKACDLLISNISTVGMSGIALLRETKRMFPFLPVIMISDIHNVDIAVKAMKLGAFDFCQKPFDRSELLREVESALSMRSNTIASNSRPLTPAEQTVLGLILESKSTKEIARIRNRSVRTIEDQRQSIMHKLGVDNIIDLVKHVESVHVNHYLKDG